MSDVATTEASTEATDPFAGISDNSRLAAEPETVKGFASIVEKFAKGARTAEITATNAKRRLAWACSWGSTFVEKPNGGPDWASASAAYAIVVTNAVTRGLGDLAPDDATKIKNAVRQHGSRWATLRAVVLYVALTGNGFSAIADTLKDVRDDWTAGLDSAALDALVKTPPDDSFILAVQNEYAKARGGKFLGLPPADSAYAVKTTDGSGSDTPGPGSDAPANAAADLNKSVAAVAKVTPLVAAEAIRDMTRSYVRHVTSEGFKFEGGTRPKIAAVLAETYNQLGLAVKMIAAQTGSEITEAELRKLTEWASDEKPANA